MWVPVLEQCYNRKRCHPSLGSVGPVDFEAHHPTRQQRAA